MAATVWSLTLLEQAYEAIVESARSLDNADAALEAIDLALRRE